MFEFETISADTLPTPWEQRTVDEGLLAMLAIGCCLIVGRLTGHEAAGAIAAGGAFTAGFAVFHPMLESPLISMALATLALTTATFAGSLAAQWTPVVLVVVAVAGLNYGLLSGLGASAGWMGLQAGVYLVIATYFPNGPHQAAGRAAAMLLGGTLQWCVHAAVRLPKLRRQEAPAKAIVVTRAKDYCQRLHHHMSWGSSTLEYSTRLLTTIVLTTAVYRHYHLRNGYWIPMTALLCLRQQWTGTLSRSIARVAGTIAGATIALLLAHSVHHWPVALLAAMIMLACLGCYALQAVNYALFSLCMTLYIVFLFRFGGFSETQAAHIRLMNTAIGGALALLIDGVWQSVAWVYGRMKPRVETPF
ncbi:MAG: FUSC family protein [Acidobacteriaceae bacterium]|nr:FUSC family protein [Acidobacteriaceae bacterium]